MKWPLLVLMSITILTMLGFPGCYDSKRRTMAHSHYHDSPSVATRQELREAKLADWKEIAIYEAALAVCLGLTLFVYLRVEKLGANKK